MFALLCFALLCCFTHYNKPSCCKDCSRSWPFTAAFRGSRGSRPAAAAAPPSCCPSSSSSLPLPPPLAAASSPASPLPRRLLDGFTVVRVQLLDAGPGAGRIGHVELNRPAKSNAFDAAMWQEFPRAVRLLQQQDDLRVLVVSAAGPNFCAGLDLSYLAINFGAKMQQQQPAACPARLRDGFRRDIESMQDAFTVLEQCRFPVIAAVQGACVGAGVDLITAADLRYCCRGAHFSVKEVDLAITADLGTLQRLPHIIGHGAAADLALTARSVDAQQAASLGLVSSCYESQPAMMEAVWKLAAELAAKSPLALTGTKAVLLHTRDQPGGVAGGLAHVALWNSAYLLSGDMDALIRARAAAGAGPPRYSKL